MYQVISKIVDLSSFTITKRAVSSLTASIYDPLGIVALQDLWREELYWNEPVSAKLSTELRTYYQSLTDLALIRIPRAYPTGKNMPILQEKTNS